VDPDKVREALGSLARVTGIGIVDAFFAVTLAQVMDPAELERNRIRRHIYLARYGRQSMLQWRDIDGREVRRYVEVLSEFLREENEAVKKAAAESAARNG
jgi:hypothetical protein